MSSSEDDPLFPVEKSGWAKWALPVTWYTISISLILGFMFALITQVDDCQRKRQANYQRVYEKAVLWCEKRGGFKDCEVLGYNEGRASVRNLDAVYTLNCTGVVCAKEEQ